MRTYRLADRTSKVHVGGFGRPHQPGQTVAQFLQGLPDFLGARDLKAVSTAVVKARAEGRPVLFAMGAHVIKVGLAPLVIDLLQAGWFSAVATNGAGMVHDFEVAWAGHTSEDVEEGLESGSFGMATETGEILNRMIRDGVSRGEGLGEAVGRRLSEAPAAFARMSILAASWVRGRPSTIHVAVGTDVHHMHAEADGASLGEGSHRDFLRFCERVSALDGGVYVNMGSAVLLPEVFLKAVSLVRNLGRPLGKIITVNMDFIQHYRPTVNVVRRPTAAGGKGYALTGHHEILLPLLAAAIKEEAASQGVVPADDRLP
jgi:hypothetical protein